MYRSKFYSKKSAILLLTGAVMYGTGDITHVAVAISGIALFAAGCFLCAVKLADKKH